MFLNNIAITIFKNKNELHATGVDNGEIANGEIESNEYSIPSSTSR